MEEMIKRFLSGYKQKNKKRFDLNTLENYLINSYKGDNMYLSNGGYPELYNQIISLKGNNYIKEIKSSNYNGLNPPLKNRWEIIFKEDISKWDKSKMLQFSDRLDFSYYVNNPLYQTDLEWEYIENIYEFLKSRDEREWASVEERSLQLFYDEKFLTDRKETAKGKYGILKRLKLTYEDLKMKKLQPIRMLGTGMDLGELNDYAYEICFLLIQNIFKRELRENHNRTRNDMLFLTLGPQTKWLRTTSLKMLLKYDIATMLFNQGSLSFSSLTK